MNHLLNLAHAVNQFASNPNGINTNIAYYSNFELMLLLLGFFLAIIGIIFLFTDDMYLGFLLVIGFFLIGIANILSNDTIKNLHDAKEKQFTKNTLLPYVQTHQQTIPIEGYACGKETKGNTYNITNNQNRIEMTIYYKDLSTGEVKAVSGNVAVYHKGNGKATLQTTQLNKSLTNKWKAGFYEPVLTLPIDSEFSCGKTAVITKK